MNDIASPVKRGLPEYKTYENQLQAVIAKRFDLPYPFPEVIHDFDHRILPDEIKVLFSSKDMWDSNYEPLGMKIKCWLPRKAEKEYINRWEEVRRA